MAYAIYTTDDDSRMVIAMVYPTAELATAAVDAAKGESVYADELVDDVEPGWYIIDDVPVRRPPPTAAETLAVVRADLLSEWRQRESEFRAAWAAHASSKAADYHRWVELNCRAIKVDANLADDDRRELLQAESRIPGADWHIQHDPTAWAAIWPDTSSSPPRDWAYYTTADGTDRHSRGGVEQAAMELDQAADFDYVHYLHG